MNNKHFAFEMMVMREFANRDGWREPRFRRFLSQLLGKGFPMVREVSNSDDIIDSRDIISRLDDLQALHDAVTDAREAREALDDDEATADEIDEANEAVTDAENDFDDDAQAEYAALKAIADEAEGYADDWRHGATLVRESYWVEYCQELCKDIGDLPDNIPPYIEIDWEKTADNIRVDYTEVDFDGVTYLVR